MQYSNMARMSNTTEADIRVLKYSEFINCDPSITTFARSDCYCQFRLARLENPFNSEYRILIFLTDRDSIFIKEYAPTLTKLIMKLVQSKNYDLVAIGNRLEQYLMSGE